MDITKAKQHLARFFCPDGGLYDAGRYLRYVPTDDFTTLDGDFTADDLEAIAAVMREQEGN